MTELEYTFRKICDRRGVTLRNIESVKFNVALAFGIAVPLDLLAPSDTVFYYAPELNFTHSGGTGTAVFYMNNNSGQGSVGNIGFLYRMSSEPVRITGVELDEFVFNNSQSAGAVYVSGSVFKITYSDNL